MDTHCPFPLPYLISSGEISFFKVSEQSHGSINISNHSKLQKHIKKLLDKLLPINFIDSPQKQSE